MPAGGAARAPSPPVALAVSETAGEAVGGRNGCAQAGQETMKKRHDRIDGWPASVAGIIAVRRLGKVPMKFKEMARDDAGL
ncbi:hypothetical protein ACTMU2_30520 [Cupriavidus basilensis]